MTTASTQDRIINLICNDIAVDLSAEDITAQSSLFDDLSFDSIKMIELLTKLEQEFEIEPVSYTHLTLPTIYSV